MPRESKPKVFGHIKLSGQLVRCRLLSISPRTGARFVQLVETFRAYKEGDKVTVGSGEFIKENS